MYVKNERPEIQINRDMYIPCPICGEDMLIMVKHMCHDCNAVLGELMKEKSFLRNIKNYFKAYKLKNR